LAIRKKSASKKTSATVCPGIGINSFNDDATLHISNTETNIWSLHFAYKKNKKLLEIYLDSVTLEQREEWLYDFDAMRLKDFIHKLEARGADKPSEIKGGFSSLLESLKDVRLRGFLYCALVILIIFSDIWGGINSTESYYAHRRYAFFDTGLGALIGFMIALAITLEWIFSGSAFRFPWKVFFKKGLKLFLIAMAFMIALLILIALTDGFVE